MISNVIEVEFKKSINLNKYKTSIEYFNYWKECKPSKYFSKFD